MRANDAPRKFERPFAHGAGPSFVRDIPEAPQSGGAASFATGFPEVNFIPVGGGGIPPWGADFNGLFRQVTAWLVRAGAGSLPLFDATFAQAIGGYPRGAVLAGDAGGVLWLSTQDSNMSPPSTGSSAWLSILTSQSLVDLNLGTMATQNTGQSSAQFRNNGQNDQRYPLRTQQIATGNGLVGGGTLEGNLSLGLSSAVLSSLGRADSAVQPGSLGTMAAQNAGTGNDQFRNNAQNDARFARPTDLGSMASRNAGTNSDQFRNNGQNDERFVALTVSVSAGAGLSGGGSLSQSRTIALSVDSQNALSAARTAVQPGDLGSLASQSSGTASSQFRTNGQNDARFMQLSGNQSIVGTKSFAALNVGDWPVAAVFTSSSRDETNYPVGTVLFARGDWNDSLPPRNATVTVRLRGSQQFDMNAGGGAVLSGTWKYRGGDVRGSNSDIHATVQRVF